MSNFQSIYVVPGTTHSSPSELDLKTSPTLKCPYRQNFYFPMRSYIEPLWKKKSIWIKTIFYESFNTWKSYFLNVYPCRWSHDRHAQSCDIDSGTCSLRSDLFCSIWIKTIFYETFNTWKSYFLNVYPCRWSHDRHAQSCDIDSRNM